MSREIKFRGLIESQNEGMQNTPTDKWVYGSLIVEPSRCIIRWVDKGNVVRAEIVVTGSVGQFTGIKDKNGVEIYEGDIVTSWTKSGNSTKLYPNSHFVREVKWTAYRAWTGFNVSGKARTTLYEVIGTTYENPELLKQSKEG